MELRQGMTIMHHFEDGDVIVSNDGMLAPTSSELTEMFLKSLNLAGYHVDEMLIDTVVFKMQEHGANRLMELMRGQ
jgi:hypothetical protein